MSVSKRSWSFRLVFAAAWLACCSAAQAHGAFGESQSLWSGVGHVLVSPLSLAAILGLALATAGVRESCVPTAAGLAGVAAALAAGAGAAMPSWLAPVLVSLVGLAAVVGQHTQPVGVAMLSLYAGTAAGRAAELDQIGLGSLVGVALGTAITAVLALVWTDDLSKAQRVKSAMAVGRRIVGAWVAAIGILLFALAVRKHGL